VAVLGRLKYSTPVRFSWSADNFSKTALGGIVSYSIFFVIVIVFGSFSSVGVVVTVRFNFFVF